MPRGRTVAHRPAAAGEVGELQLVGQPEAEVDVDLAPAEDRHVGGDDQRAAAGFLDAGDEVVGLGPVAVDVELEKVKPKEVNPSGLVDLIPVREVRLAEYSQN